MEAPYNYDRKYFLRQLSEKRLRDANRIAGVLHAGLEPTSVVDLGCGTAALLHCFSLLKVDRILGVELAEPAIEMALIPGQFILRHDLSEPLDIGRRFDLAVSFEVAEHITDANNLIDSLCRLSDTVAFTACWPTGGGEGHVNEQPPIYWIKAFEKRGYMLDVPTTNSIKARLRFLEELTWIRDRFMLFRRLKNS